MQNKVDHFDYLKLDLEEVTIRKFTHSDFSVDGDDDLDDDDDVWCNNRTCFSNQETFYMCSF